MQPVRVRCEPIKVRRCACLVHPVKIGQVVQTGRAAGRFERGRQSSGQYDQSRICGFGCRIRGAQQIRVRLGVYRPKAPFEAQVRFVPQDDVIHAPPVASSKVSHKTCELGVILVVNISQGRFLLVLAGPGPTGHPAQPGYYVQTLAPSVINDLVRMLPGVLPGGWFNVGPREKLHDPGRAHLPHHTKCALIFHSSTSSVKRVCTPTSALSVTTLWGGPATTRG